MLVNMGPQHPSTHGVLRLHRRRPTARSCREAMPHIGYLHRCAEKIGENVHLPRYMPYTDRMDYLAGMNTNDVLGAGGREADRAARCRRGPATSASSPAS